MKRILVPALVAAGILAAGEASAQAASDQVKSGCRQVADNVARTIESARRAGVKDLERGVTKPSSNWGEQVATYMIQAASRSDSLSQSELASLGYAYCVERRPRN